MSRVLCQYSAPCFATAARIITDFVQTHEKISFGRYYSGSLSCNLSLIAILLVYYVLNCQCKMTQMLNIVTRFISPSSHNKSSLIFFAMWWMNQSDSTKFQLNGFLRSSIMMIYIIRSLQVDVIKNI